MSVSLLTMYLNITLLCFTLFYILLGLESSDALLSLVPVIIYSKANEDKPKIVEDNRDKSGVYFWTNLINGKRYVGSSQHLSIRLLQYFNPNFLLRNTSMAICRALLKHGHQTFSLTILEYCEPGKCLEREGYYIKLLKPEYNISEFPTAPFTGLKHSSATRAKMSSVKVGLQAGEKHPMFGLKLSDVTRKKLSDANKGENHPMFGKKHREETLQKMSAANTHMVGKKFADETRLKISIAQKGESNTMFGKKHTNETIDKIREKRLGQARPEGSGRPHIKIEVVDHKSNQTTTYDSISAAAIALGIGKSTISKYVVRSDQKSYKGQYTFKKV